MMEVGAPVGADVSDVWIAQHLRDMHPDFEDDMVLAAARRAGVDYLVTSDRQLIQKADVVALTPEDMLTVLRNQRALQGDC
jgi:predicted nucleic acid-binding protein